MDEFKRISFWTSDRQSPEWQGKRGVVLGIGDDAAVVNNPGPHGVKCTGADNEAAGPGNGNFLLAMDTMVETIHFNETTMTDEDVGYKALAANVSDIAAMGGLPLHALVSVSMPRSSGAERIRRIYDGLYDCADRYGVAIVGGDTTSSPDKLVLSVTLTGTVESGQELRRSGARPGNKVFLTGPVGMSAAGLHVLQARGEDAGSARRVSHDNGDYAALVNAHRRPRPAVKAGRMLLASGSCTSLNDVSDGVASEAWELAEASGLRIVLDERLLPRSGSMTSYAGIAGTNPLEWMLYGGEDYVLLGTISEDAAEDMAKAFHEEGMPFYIIGFTEAGEPGVELIPEDVRSRLGDKGRSGRAEQAERRDSRRRLDKRGYNHFGE